MVTRKGLRAHKKEMEKTLNAFQNLHPSELEKGDDKKMSILKEILENMDKMEAAMKEIDPTGDKEFHIEQ